MIRRPTAFPPRLPCALALAAALTGAAAATAPGQTPPRTSDYEVLSVGDAAISARCDDGGFVFVARHGASPAARAESAPARPGAKGSHGLPADRDASIRAACRTIDYTR